MKFIYLFLAAVLGGLVAAGVILTTQRASPEAPIRTYVAALNGEMNSFDSGRSDLRWSDFRGAGEERWPDKPKPAVDLSGTESLQSASSKLAGPIIDLRTAARIATPSVVHIDARATGRDRDAVKALFGRRDPRGRTGGEGSGVIYSSDGYIVTNYHVVEATNEITVTLSDRRRFAASLVGAEPKTDLAVLKIEAVELPYLRLADSDEAVPGQWVLAVGSPLGLTSTVTAGIVSAKGRNLSLLRDLDAIESFLQTDAAVNPGNSGGPLVDAEGKLLGINTAIASETGRFQGYSFAIPINLVRRIVDDIIEFGTYRRALLGVEISTLTRADVRRLGLTDRTEGVVVDAIFPDGSADRGGLRADDLIIAVDDRNIRDLPELTEIIGRARPGDTLRLTVIRDNARLQLAIELLASQE